MIAISKQFTSSKIALLQTNYEILRKQIIMNKGTNLYVAIDCTYTTNILLINLL